MGNTAGTGGKTVTATSDGTIRWVDFNVSYEALCKAYECDVDTYGSEMHIDWIDLLSYVAAKNGGEFGATAVSELNEAAEKVKNKELTFDEAAEKLKYFPIIRRHIRRCLAVWSASMRYRRVRVVPM